MKKLEKVCLLIPPISCQCFVKKRISCHGKWCRCETAWTCGRVTVCSSGKGCHEEVLSNVMLLHKLSNLLKTSIGQFFARRLEQTETSIKEATRSANALDPEGSPRNLEASAINVPESAYNLSLAREEPVAVLHSMEQERVSYSLNASSCFLFCLSVPFSGMQSDVALNVRVTNEHPRNQIKFQDEIITVRLLACVAAASKPLMRMFTPTGQGKATPRGHVPACGRKQGLQWPFPYICPPQRKESTFLRHGCARSRTFLLF